MSESLWPIPPNWIQGVQENLEWMTSVAESPAGVEQRMGMRSYPRRRIDYTAMVTDTDRAFLDNLVSAKGSTVFRLPLWFDRYELLTPLPLGATQVMMATAVHEFVAGNGAVAVFGNGPRDNTVVEIDTVLSDRINLVAPTAAIWPAGTVLHPLTAARLLEQPKASRRSDTVWDVTLSFMASRYNPWETTLWVPTTYRSFPVLTTAPDDIAARQTEFLRVMETIDSGLAEVLYADTAGAGLRLQAHAWMTYGLQENAEFRAFLYRLRGRQKALWLPTFTADFDLLEAVDSGDTTLTVARCGFADVQGIVENRRDIQIALMDGTALYRRITAANVVGNTEVLTLGSAVGQAIAIDDVLRISIMSMARLDGDGVEITHHTDIEGSSTCAAVFRTFLDQRTATAWVPEPWPFPDELPEGDCAVPIGSTNVVARVFNSQSFDNQFGARTYPLTIDGVVYVDAVTNLRFGTGAALEYTGSSQNPVLFLELIATDGNLVALPRSEQPTKWEIVSAPLATTKNSVDRNTFILYNAWMTPVYAGIRVGYTAAYGAVATLDVVDGGGLTSNGGLTFTSTVANTGARTSLGRSTGKWLVRNTHITTTRVPGIATVFGFMASTGVLNTGAPGNVGSPAPGTAFDMGTIGLYLGNNAVYRIYSQSNQAFVLTRGPVFSYAIDLDAKKYWFNMSDGGVDTGWMYDNGTAPVLDAALAIGTSYATKITTSNTLYPFIYHSVAAYSGSVNFAPTGLPSAPGFFGWSEATTKTDTISVRGQRPDNGQWLYFTFTYKYPG